MSEKFASKTTTGPPDRTERFIDLFNPIAIEMGLTVAELEVEELGWYRTFEVLCLFDGSRNRVTVSTRNSPLYMIRRIIESMCDLDSESRKKRESRR